MNRSKREQAAHDRQRGSIREKKEHSKYISQGLSIRDLPSRTGGAEPETKEDRYAIVFKHNLGVLLTHNGIHPRDAAKRIGVDRRWFNRILKEGLQFVSPRTKTQLEKISSFLKVTVDDLWNAELDEKLKPVFEKRVVPARKSKHWPVAEQLLTLLEEERFQFLVPLIAEFYITRSQSIPTWSMGPDDKKVRCGRCQQEATVSEFRKYDGICAQCFKRWHNPTDEEESSNEETFDWRLPSCRRCYRNKSLEELTRGDGFCESCLEAVKAIHANE